MKSENIDKVLDVVAGANDAALVRLADRLEVMVRNDYDCPTSATAPSKALPAK